MTTQDLTSKAFYYLNGYKRHRALADIARKEGNMEKAQYHELKQYKLIDQLELAMRAIQKDIRGEQKEEE